MTPPGPAETVDDAIAQGLAGPGATRTQIAAWRVRFDRRFASTYEPLAHALALHWLALANAALAVFLGLAFVAPALMALGLAGPARSLYSAYALVCHQWAFRSFFLFGERFAYPLETLRPLVGEQRVYEFIGSPMLGYKVAFCERDVAIYAAMLLTGLLYARVRGRLRPPSLPVIGCLILPIALDGFTQLLGLRESTWQLRAATGALFGVAFVWLMYPQLERSSLRARRAYGL